MKKQRRRYTPEEKVAILTTQGLKHRSDSVCSPAFYRPFRSANWVLRSDHGAYGSYPIADNMKQAIFT
jgi:hypothetical protein